MTQGVPGRPTQVVEELKNNSKHHSLALTLPRLQLHTNFCRELKHR